MSGIGTLCPSLCTPGLSEFFETRHSEVFNASLSNVKIYRSITMAQDLAPNGLLNTSTGTRAVNSIFSQAYIYSPSGYYTWGTSQTSTAERRAPYQRQLNTITVNSYTKWNSENISIMFNQ